MTAPKRGQGAAPKPASGDAPRFSPHGPGLVVRRARVSTEQVAWLRYVLEAEDGLAFMHSDGSGIVLILCPEGRAAEMDALMVDLLRDGCLAEILPDEAEGAPEDSGSSVI